MQYSTIGDLEVSRFGVGMKRIPMQDASRVTRLDRTIASEAIQTALDHGVNYFDTSYSDAKGETESFLGEAFEQAPANIHVSTSYFELVDNRFDYVFQKQVKKLMRPQIDLYYIEGVCDLTYERDIDSGAVDFLFGRKEAGEIGQLGFSSELKPENLKKYMGLYPWDFVRMRINFYDWFNKDAKECYEIAREANLPIIAHTPLRFGAKGQLKPETLAVMRDADPVRSSVDWALRFVKSLDGVASVTSNVCSAKQVEDAVAVFTDDTVLSEAEFDVLAAAAQAQKTIIPKRA